MYFSNVYELRDIYYSGVPDHIDMILDRGDVVELIQRLLDGLRDKEDNIVVSVSGVLSEKYKSVGSTPKKINGCARCGQDHKINFEPLLNPADEWTHWGVCENTKQPVWMRFVEEEPIKNDT